MSAELIWKRTTVVSFFLQQLNLLGSKSTNMAWVNY